MSVKRRRRKVVKLRIPGPPAPCREMPAADDAVTTLTRYHHWQDEKQKRDAQHLNLNEALEGVIPPSGDAVIVPSSLLYGGQLEANTQQWDQRWWTARLTELGHFGLADLLASLDSRLSCRGFAYDAATALARTLGWRVHVVIQDRYRKARAGNRVSTDGRVYTIGGSERLSELARQNPRGEYATLNFALAGNRVDIVDFTSREMWEIKPASRASEAVLQLWAYLDNHEVARVFDGLVEDGASVPPLVPGNTLNLPQQVLEPFTIRLRGVPTVLTIQPYTVDRLPGLILYTVGADTGRRGRQAAAAAIAQGRTEMSKMLILAQRTEAERRQAEIESLKLAQNVAIGVLVVCVITLIVGGGYIILVGFAPAAPALAPAATAVVAETAPVMASVTRLVVQRAVLTETTTTVIPAVVEAIPKAAAGLVIVAAGAGQFTMPPEGIGPVVDAGASAGVALGQNTASDR